MKKIAMVAAPYCFGPIGKLLCIAEELTKRHPLVLFGGGPGIELAKDTCFFCDIVEICDRDRWNSSARNALNDVSLFVSFLEYRCLPIAYSRGIPAIFFDTLLWLRTTPPQFTSDTNCYISQNFFGGNGECKPLNLLPVGPILPANLQYAFKTVNGRKGLSVLVNVGGLNSPTMSEGADENYIAFVLHIVGSAAPEFWNARICMPRYLKERLAAKGCVPRENVLICSPRREEFYDYLQTADILLTVPGLEAVYEALYVRTPIAFLPPHNGTQYHQARIYQALNLGIFTIWPDFLDHIPVSNDPSEMTRTVQKAHGQLLNDCHVLSTCGAQLRRSLADIQHFPYLLGESVKRGAVLLHSLGDPGRDLAVETIEGILVRAATQL